MNTASATRLRLIYAILTVVGFVVPNAYVARYFREHGLSAQSVRAFFGDWFSTVPTTALTWDLGITSLSFWIWSFDDARRRGVRHWWLIPTGTSTVGICFAVPLYFLMRSLSATNGR